MAEFRAVEWAQNEYGRAQVGDARLTKRLVSIGAELVQNSAVSIPVAMGSWAQTKGMYRLVSNHSVTHAAILKAHVQATSERSRGEKRILVVQDTTHFSFGGAREGSGLGPVDTTRKTRGFLAHSALAIVGDERRPLGLLAQRVWARPKKKRRATETCVERKRRPRESEKWEDVAAEVHANLASLGELRPQVVHVCDAEGDVFEALETLDALGDGFIIRACRNRLLDSERDDDDPEYLLDAVAAAPHLGEWHVNVPPGPKRTARRARLQIRSVDIYLRPPRNRHRVGKSLAVSVVSAFEPDPPEGEEPLTWVLLTREHCASLEEAVAVVCDYALRWIIEEFHMGLKTGCSLEKREFQTFARLANVLAIYSPIAMQMLVLRHAARSTPTAPAASVLPPSQLRALRVLRPKLSPQLTVYEALRAVAQIGGFLARKSDGEPGWRTLWLGYRELLAAERVVLALERSG